MKSAIVVGCVALIVSCGGKMVGEAAGDGGAALADDQPPPTCGAICDRLATLCAGSPNEKCVTDCTVTETKYLKCPHELDRFMKCMGVTQVKCTSDEIIVLDCSQERVALESCGI
jgi:hypothetical protein